MSKALRNITPAVQRSAVLFVLIGLLSYATIGLAAASEPPSQGAGDGYVCPSADFSTDPQEGVDGCAWMYRRSASSVTVAAGVDDRAADGLSARSKMTLVQYNASGKAISRRNVPSSTASGGKGSHNIATSMEVGRTTGASVIHIVVATCTVDQDGEQTGVKGEENCQRSQIIGKKAWP